jgi:hypothetical protein
MEDRGRISRAGQGDGPRAPTPRLRANSTHPIRAHPGGIRSDSGCGCRGRPHSVESDRPGHSRRLPRSDRHRCGRSPSCGGSAKRSGRQTRGARCRDHGRRDARRVIVRRGDEGEAQTGIKRDASDGRPRFRRDLPFPESARYPMVPMKDAGPALSAASKADDRLSGRFARGWCTPSSLKEAVRGEQADFLLGPRSTSSDRWLRDGGKSLGTPGKVPRGRTKPGSAEGTEGNRKRRRENRLVATLAGGRRRLKRVEVIAATKRRSDAFRAVGLPVEADSIGQRSEQNQGPVGAALRYASRGACILHTGSEPRRCRTQAREGN